MLLLKKKKTGKGLRSIKKDRKRMCNPAWQRSLLLAHHHERQSLRTQMETCIQHTRPGSSVIFLGLISKRGERRTCRLVIVMIK